MAEQIEVPDFENVAKNDPKPDLVEENLPEEEFKDALEKQPDNLINANGKKLEVRMRKRSDLD
jgi:hypothetical protein